MVKTCKKDEPHTWISDTTLCPYCNHSVDVRIEYLQNERK